MMLTFIVHLYSRKKINTRFKTHTVSREHMKKIAIRKRRRRLKIDVQNGDALTA